MAFPFYVYNIAYLTTGFKSEMQNCSESKLVRPKKRTHKGFPHKWVFPLLMVRRLLKLWGGNILTLLSVIL